jgi:hypothetical protein
LQSQVGTERLLAGAHPHAPIAQVSGKAGAALAQQRLVVTVPPLAVQSFSSAGAAASSADASAAPPAAPTEVVRSQAHAKNRIASAVLSRRPMRFDDIIGNG